MPDGGAAFTLHDGTGASRGADPDRQMVVLEQSDWSAWLKQTAKDADLRRSLPVGSLEQVARSSTSPTAP